MKQSDIAALREQLGWSKHDLAAATGLADSQIGRIESGRHRANRGTLALIEAALRKECTARGFSCPGFPDNSAPAGPQAEEKDS